MPGVTCRQRLHKLFVTVILGTATMAPHAAEVTLAVANSTCTALKKVGDLYRQQHNVDISYICKSSGRLAKGLAGDAIKADIYVSANQKWMDFMLESKLISPDQVSTPWSNELVVATPAKSAIENFQWQDIASEQVKSILIGDPGTAPFGRYAKQAMESSGLWEQVRHKITTKKHITLLAETLAASDANTIGILFLSNAKPPLRIVHAIDKTWHKPINYFLGPLIQSQDKQHVQPLVEFIQSNEAREIFLAEGFIVESD